MEQSLKYNLDELVEGISPQRAIELFLSACNKHDTLFITDWWIEPRLRELRQLLSDPLTSAEVEALRDAVMKRAHIDDVIGWLKDKSLPWSTYNKGTKWLKEETKCLQEQQEIDAAKERFLEADRMRRQRGEQTIADYQRNDVWLQSRYPSDEARQKYGAQAKGCPRCGRTPDMLTWFYCIGGPKLERWPPGAVCILFKRLFGRMTYCEHCDLDVDYFVEHYM